MKHLIVFLCLFICGRVQASIVPWRNRGITFQVAAPINSNPDSSTSAASKINFDEGGTSTMTADSVAPIINGNLFTSNPIASMWVSTGVNNTAAVHVGTGLSTATIIFQDDDRYSGHAGANGQQSMCMVLNPTSLSINQHYMNKSAGASDYEFEIGYTNSCAANNLNIVYYNSTAASKACAGVQGTMFAVGKSTSLCFSYDAVQTTGKVQIYIGGKPAVMVSATDNAISTINGVAPLRFGRRGAGDDNNGEVVVDRIRIFNYIASKETATNYENDLLVLSRMREDPAFKWWYANHLAPYGYSTTWIVKNDWTFNHPIDFMGKHDFQNEAQIESRKSMEIAVSKVVMNGFFARKTGEVMVLAR